MQINNLSTRDFSLLQTVGHGRFSENEMGRIAFYFSKMEGSGFYLPAYIDDQAALFFVNESAWLNAMQSLLTFPSLAQLSKELHPLLAQYTLSLLEPWLTAPQTPRVKIKHDSADSSASVASQSFIEATQLLPTYCWTIEIQHEATKLSFAVIEAPDSWLNYLATQLEPRTNSAGSLDDFDNEDKEFSETSSAPSVVPAMQTKLFATLTLPIVLGYSCLDQSEIDTLKVGDAIVLEKHCAIEIGELWIQHKETLYSARHLHALSTENANTHEYHIETRAPFASQQNLDSSALSPVLLKTGRVEISVAQVSAFSVQADRPLAQLIPQFDTDISLEINKQLFARGELLKMGENWVVQITHRLNTSARGDSPQDEIGLGSTDETQF